MNILEICSEFLLFCHPNSISRDLIFLAFGEDDDSLNPFMEAQPPSLGPPEWVLELPEELDQAIAQRNFEEAVELVDSGREFFDMSPKTPAYSEMRLELNMAHYSDETVPSI